MTPPTVLIVEDDQDTREMLTSFLQLEGYLTETATNGREALDRLAGGIKANIIVLDLMMPVMDGWQFRRRQIEDAQLAKIPTIVVSAAGRGRMAQISADAHLAKPIDMDELLFRLSQFCAI
ncbi:MAG: response regulator [Vicinamibacterales bacterium]